MAILRCLWKIAVPALVLAAAGCSDFSQHRFGGVRRSADAEEGPPRPGTALAIRNPPSITQPHFDNQVKPVEFAPQREPIAPLDPHLQPLQNPLRTLYVNAAQQAAKMDAYTFRVKRREVVGDRKIPEEVVQIKFRVQPYSVHIKWLSDEGKGREVVFVRGKYKDEMQILLAPKDFGYRLLGKVSKSVDDPMVRASSRYPITETGFGAMIEHYGKVVGGAAKGDPREGSVKYLGKIDRPEFPAKLDTVYQEIPVGSDALLPKGGKRWWFFDPASGLPMLRITHDPNGEVEYYCHDQVQAARFTDDDFNIERLWRK